MKATSIEKQNKNTIASCSVRESTEAVLSAVGFRSEAEFAQAAAECPLSHLAETWNSLPGVTPVKKFTDRKTAISRIWKAVEASSKSSMPTAASETYANQPARPGHARKEPAAAKQTRTVARKENTGNESARPVNRGQARQGSKTSKVVRMLRRDGGATPQELMRATGWQAHSLRGFLSGTVHKKMGLRVVLTKNEAGVQRYTVTQ